MLRIFFAINKDGCRVDAYSSEKGEKYFCPICGQEVRLKQGKINDWHFAHITSCSDTWEYQDINNEWHIRMQAMFKPEYREVVVEHNGEKHRADILKDGVVIEFQHSPISVKDFCSRNNFYSAAGYKVCWIFDLRDVFRDNRVENLGKNKYRWKYPMKVLRFGPIPQERMTGDQISICFYTSEFGVETNRSCYSIYRVNWASLDDSGVPNYKYFFLNEGCDINIDQPWFEMKMLFFRPKDWVAWRRKQFANYRCVFIGEKGHCYSEYLCPITNTWSGRYLCADCSSCGLLDTYKETTRCYCCYPKQPSHYFNNNIVR